MQATTAASGNTGGIARARLIAGVVTIAASSTALVMGACSSGTENPGPDGDGGREEDGTGIAVYGSPPADAQVKDVVNSVDAAYGGPPIHDDSGVAPAYGSPPQFGPPDTEK